MFYVFAVEEVERNLAPLAQHAPQKYGEKLKLLVQLIGVFCRLLRSSIKVCIVILCELLVHRSP